MSIKELMALSPPPDEPTELPDTLDWIYVEEQLNTKLPRDYKEYVETFGSGLFAGFIRIFNPWDSSPYMSLLLSAISIPDMYNQIKDSAGDDVLPFPLYPEKGGLLPCGNDENGNYMFWLTKGTPNKWPIVVAEGRGPRWQKFDLPLTVFLTEILRRSIRCEIWPSDFPPRRKTFPFHPYK